jgi:hypothetical protein
MHKRAGDIITGIISGLLTIGVAAVVGRLAWLRHIPDYYIILLVLAAIGLSLFVINQWKQGRWKRGISKLSDKKIENIIREWIDIPGFTIERRPKETDINFNFQIKDKQNRYFNIIRDTVNPSMIQLVARVNLEAEDRSFSKLYINKIAGKIKLELARFGIEYIFEDLKYIQLIDSVIIEDSLKEFDFRRRMFFVMRAIVLILVIIEQAKEEYNLPKPEPIKAQ